MEVNYDIIWREQSENSAGSMPVGGFDLGANVWVEKDELMLYVDRSGSFDENNQMLKLGRFRLQFEPNPFQHRFVQRLHLVTGNLTVEGDGGFCADIWFQTDSPMLHIDIRADKPVQATISYETWRIEPRLLDKSHMVSPFSYQGYPGDVYTWPDCIAPHDDRLLFCHQNRNDKLLFDFLVDQQGLQAVRDELMNPQKDLLFGGRLAGQGLRYCGEARGEYASVPYVGYQYATTHGCSHAICVGFHAGQMPMAQWTDELEALYADQSARTDARDTAQRWWRDFWTRSYIHINPSKDSFDEGHQIARNFALFRYMQGCNAYGAYPTKFNGGLFTTDAMYSVDAAYESETPDYRRWGGGSFTAQNQRLVYWPMLKNGDFDMMAPQFQYYLRALPNSLLRTRQYWGHGGCSFPEQVENFGLPVGACWGFDAPATKHHLRPAYWDPFEVRCPWIQYEYVTQLEFSYMMLQYHRYTGADISALLPFIDACVTFFAEHYEMIHMGNSVSPLDADGHWVISPSTALETYKNAVNPTDVLSALRAVLEVLCDLSEGEQRTHYQTMISRIPPIAEREREGVRCIAPAKSWTGIINQELPQLYPVFPYGQYGVGRDRLQLAIDTYWHGVDLPSQRGYESWRQDGIFAARLGLTEEARRITKLKLLNGPLRFPAFWGPGFDWLPDHNWGGSGMIGLQEMLVQCVEDTIYLFPSWPKEWEVSFKLHLPCQTVIEATWNGKEASWTVTSQRQYQVTLPEWA